MGVAVAILNPQDCLKQTLSRKTLIYAPSKVKHQKNPEIPNQNRSNRKTRRSPTGSRASSPTVEKPSAPMLTGNIKILKRGEDLPEATPDPLSPTGLLGPGPGSFGSASNRLDGFYAGSSSSIVSPPPSSLPHPAFFAKKVVGSTNSEATNALLQMLRIDLV